MAHSRIVVAARRACRNRRGPRNEFEHARRNQDDGPPRAARAGWRPERDSDADRTQDDDPFIKWDKFDEAELDGTTAEIREFFLKAKHAGGLRLSEFKDFRRVIITWLVEEFSPLAAEAEVALVSSLRHSPFPEVRKQIAEELCIIGKRSTRAVSALAAAVQEDTDGDVREAAAYALGEIGPAAAEAVPALLAVLEASGTDISRLISSGSETDFPTRNVLRTVARALWSIQPETAKDHDIPNLDAADRIRSSSA
jgi:HEAT repeat protein